VAAAAFIAIYFFHVPFPLIIISAALIGFFGGKWKRDKFLIIRGHGKANAESVLDDSSAVPDHAKPSWPRGLRITLVWLILWSAPVLRVAMKLAGGTQLGEEPACCHSKPQITNYPEPPEIFGCSESRVGAFGIVGAGKRTINQVCAGPVPKRTKQPATS
jgi:hypothetical protein